jgi:cysteine synthase
LVNPERVHLIRSYGAEVVSVSKAEGGFLSCIRRCEELAAHQPGVFLPRQFSNPANTLAHTETTGPEIWSQLLSIGKRPQAFVAGVGAGGTVMGVGRFLREGEPSIRIHPDEPAESPSLSTGCKLGTHRIQGISGEFIPEIVRLNGLDEILSVSDGDAILMAQKLALDLGLAVAISSGCNFLAAVKAQEKLGTDAAVVTVFCDDNKKYLSTALMSEESLRPDYLSPRIELLGIGTVSSACEFCH